MACPCFFRYSVLIFLLPPPSVCAEERRSRRIRAKTCLSRRRVVFDPAGPSTAGCPKRSEGTQTAGRLFFCLLFFWRSKRKVSSCRATPGQQHAAKSTPIKSTANLAEDAINSIAARARPHWHRNQLNTQTLPRQKQQPVNQQNIDQHTHAQQQLPQHHRIPLDQGRCLRRSQRPRSSPLQRQQ
jgi:hypothetical protein